MPGEIKGERASDNYVWCCGFILSFTYLLIDGLYLEHTYPDAFVIQECATSYP